jgi:cytoskeleton protein RodZ
MESYGELLRKAREAKGLSVEEVSHEITVEKTYLQAIEDEESSVLPGEAYFIGYLRNYSNYLELDTDYILKLYHNKKLQEAPVPQELIIRQKPRFLIPVIVIPAVILVAIVAVLSILLYKKNASKTEETEVKVVQTKNKSYELSEKKFSERVYEGDHLIYPTEKGTEIVLTVKSTKGDFGLDTPAGTFYVELSEESELDVDGDSVSDMIVYVSDISNNDASRGAEISVLMRNSSSASGTLVADVSDIPLASEIKSKYPQKVILEDNRAYPFTINATFRANCLFRNKVDREDSNEAYFSKGEVFTSTPKNGIRLWISNSNAVSFQITADSRTFDLGTGAAGQVLVEDIKWIKDTDGKYKLVVIELD